MFPTTVTKFNIADMTIIRITSANFHCLSMCRLKSEPKKAEPLAGLWKWSTNDGVDDTEADAGVEEAEANGDPSWSPCCVLVMSW